MPLSELPMMRALLQRPPKKLADAKRNGKLVREKPAFEVGQSTMVNDLAPIDYRQRIGTIAALGPGKSEYRVTFDDGDMPTSGSMLLRWLDRDG